MRQEMKTLTATAGNVHIGSDYPIAVQTMCNTHTYDEDATVAQCKRMYEAGVDIVRITVPGLPDVQHAKAIHDRLRTEGIDTPIVADIHFSSETAIAVAPFVEKVRINPGNYVDKVKTFSHLEYTDEEYAAEIEKIREQIQNIE